MDFQLHTLSAFINKKSNLLCAGFEITSVSKNQQNDAITHIAGTNNFGTTWKLSVARAILGIESGDWYFYVAQNGTSNPVSISVLDCGKKILTNENRLLLLLPECSY